MENTGNGIFIPELSFSLSRVTEIEVVVNGRAARLRLNENNSLNILSIGCLVRQLLYELEK